MNWDIQEEIALTGHKSAVHDVCFLNGSEKLISASEMGVVRLWRITDSKTLLSRRLHSDTIYDLSVSPGGGEMATISADRTLSVWDLSDESSHPVSQVLDSTAYCLEHLRDDTLAMGMDNGCIVLRDIPGCHVNQVSHAHEDAVNDMQCSPSGEFLVSASRNGEVSLWATPELQLYRRFHGAETPVKCVDFSADGVTVAAGDEEGRVLLWDAHMSSPIACLETCNESIADIKFHPSGRLLLVLGSSGFLYTRDITSTDSAEIDVCGEGANCLSISSDGRLVAVGCGDSSIRLLALWPEKVQAEGHLKRHVSWTCRYCFAPLTVRDVERLKANQPVSCCYCGRTLTLELYE